MTRRFLVIAAVAFAWSCSSSRAPQPIPIPQQPAAQPAHADGELMVMPATTKVFNNHDQNVTVKNMGDAPLYLSISVQKVMNPGKTPEEKQNLGELQHPGMLASPDKLTLGPNQSRSITLRSLAEPENEELYRLYIVPVRSLKVDDAPQDKIADVLLRPGHYAKIVAGIRADFRRRHTPEARLRRLIEIVQE